MFPDGIAGYTGVGRVKWEIPEGSDFGCGFAVPHFTQGARVLCGTRDSRTRTEISVYSRDLTIDAAARREKFVAELKSHLREAVESSVELRSYGSETPVLYASLTRRGAGSDRPRATVGYRVKGPFLVRFLHETTSDSPAELEQVLRVVLSAEPLDALPTLAWKLSDYKAVCDERYPKLRRLNEAALAASMFARVDWRRSFLESDPKRGEAEAAKRLKQARDDLADQLTRGGNFEAFFGTFWQMTFEAERGLPAARQRAHIGVFLKDSSAGVVLDSVSADGPAAAAGLRAGDLILQFANESVADSTDVFRAMIGTRPGTAIQVRISRDGTVSETTVATASAPD